MQIAILILLAVVALILLWLVLQSQKKTVDPTSSLLQQEVQSLRGQLTEAMLKSQETVNHQLGQITLQVNTQLGQTTLDEHEAGTGDPAAPEIHGGPEHAGSTTRRAWSRK